MSVTLRLRMTNDDIFRFEKGQNVGPLQGPVAFDHSKIWKDSNVLFFKGKVCHKMSPRWTSERT